MNHVQIVLIFIFVVDQITLTEAAIPGFKPKDKSENQNNNSEVLNERRK